ncbi:MAG: hypothetical protein KatS3mg003_1310 [Candidatus Nitrosocaldaceae archaeon]|nr:MAG: hypothetical protein KatS3mg003_1310 [Candidatus Nitrosocaldaceae archaeon]
MIMAEEIRIGYYKKSKNGKWIWARAAPLLPIEDLNELIMISKERSIL